MHVIGAANLDVKSFPGNDRFRKADAIGFNFLNPAFDDRRVRRAITLGIDRAKPAAVVGHGLDKTDRVLLPMFEWAEDPAAEPPVFDPLSANRLLDEAAWRVGADGIRRKGDRKLRFTMVYTAGGNGVLPATIAADL